MLPRLPITVGQFVTLTYFIRNEHGQVLEQTDVPVNYIHGGDTELIGGMDAALTGHYAGDEINFTLTPATSGFGEYDPTLTFTDAIENVPPELRVCGTEVVMQNDAGEQRTFYVTDISNGQLTIDGNHPLAGKQLHVTVRIVDVSSPPLQ